MSTYRQIIVKATDPMRKEGVASEAITPGDLIEYVGGSAATGGQLKKHATSGGNAGPRFMLEQSYIGEDIDDACAALDNIPFIYARRGDEIYARLAANNNVLYGSPLESNGDGTLKLHSPTSAGGGTLYKGSIVAYAREPQNSGSVSRLVVEVA